MRLLASVIIVALILLVAGLYYIPDTTKEVMQLTGSVVVDTSEKVLDKVKETEFVQNTTKQIKEKIPSLP